MSFTAFELLAGLSLDLLLGDPRWLPNPVRGVRWLASRAERQLRAIRLPLYVSGALLTLCFVALFALAVWYTLPWANIYWIYALVAIRSLDHETIEVVRHLDQGNLEAARVQLATIVGEDTAHLDQGEIMKCVIETMSQNLSDVIIAPLFYLLIGGPAAMAAYKAVNTLGRMARSPNGEYDAFGWASVRLDDLAGFLPARLTAILVWIAAAGLWMNFPRAVRITLRDAAGHGSLNAGYPQAAFAGAVGIQLAENIGDPVNPVDRAAWEYARALVFVSTLLMVLLAILVIGW